MGNQPTIAVDPDGEWVWLIPIVVGAVVNTAANWDDINSTSDFFGYAGVGALSGAATLIPGIGPAAAGAIAGGLNGLGNGAMRGQTGWDLAASTGIGAVAGMAAGGAVSGLNTNIASPLADGLVKGAVGGAAGGFVGGGLSSAYAGGDFLEGAWAGAKSGAITGAVVGGALSSYSAASRGFNPLTGQRTNAWLAKNPALGVMQSKGATGLKGIGQGKAPTELPRVASNTSDTHSGLQGARINTGDLAGKKITPYYPRNGGFAGTPKEIMLRPGQLVDRFGPERGSYLAPKRTPAAGRALAPGTTSDLSSYQVVKPFPVQSGPAAPWFGQPGGGTQFVTPVSVGDLVRLGYLRRL